MTRGNAGVGAPTAIVICHSTPHVLYAIRQHACGDIPSDAVGRGAAARRGMSDGIRANMSVHSTHSPTTLGKYGRAIRGRIGLDPLASCDRISRGLY